MINISRNFLTWCVVNPLSLFLSISSITSMYGFEIENHVPTLDDSSIETLDFVYPRCNESGSLKLDFLKKLKRLFQVNAFVESGTFLGGTTAEASKLFKEVYSIELSEYFYRLARKRFSDTSNVQLILGDSGSVFPDLLPKILHSTLFYLDGHYSGGHTKKGEKNTPILKELEAIKKFGRSDSIILIDDIRLFQTSAKPKKIQNTCKKDYPCLPVVIDKLLEINKDFQFCFLGDALLAFSKNTSVSISPFLQACTLQRMSIFYPSFGSDLLIDSAEVISTVKGKELSELTFYYEHFAESEIEDGFFCFASLWHGLTLMDEDKVDQGSLIIERTLKNSLPTINAEQLIGPYLNP